MDTNNAIIREIQGFKALFEEKFKENTKEHVRVISQVEKTNGRVKSLELWRSFLFGAWAVVVLLLSVGFFQIF